MLRVHPTIASSLLLALFFLPLVESFTLSPSLVVIRQQQHSCQLPGHGAFLRLKFTAAEGVELGPKVAAKKDKITNEAQELLDVFAARARGEAKHNLIVAQVAPSVR
jgi:hypothetical protein